MKKKQFSFFIISITLVSLITLLLFEYPITVSTGKIKNKMPIRSVLTQQKVVSLSFDTGGSSRNIYPLLELLNKYQVKSTFFVCGYWYDRYSSYVKRIYDNGHDIGNHGTNHLYSTKISSKKLIEEIEVNHQKIADNLGYQMDLFRVPYDDYNNKVLEVIEQQNYYTIQWSIDSYDWRGDSKNQIVNRVLESIFLKNGAIILFHDDGENTIEALEVIIPKLFERGFEIIPVSSLIYRNDYTIDAIGRQIKTSVE